MRLNLGSGRHHWKGFINIDIDAKYKPDVVLDISKGKLPCKNNSVDEIVMNHSLEHLFKSEAIAILKECHKVLKTYGTLILELPELAKMCRLFLSTYDNNKPCPKEEGVNGFYGDTAEYDNSPYQIHKWGWTEKALREILERIGFTITEISDGKFHRHPERDIFIRAEK